MATKLWPHVVIPFRSGAKKALEALHDNKLSIHLASSQAHVEGQRGRRPKAHPLELAKSTLGEKDCFRRNVEIKGRRKQCQKTS